MSAVSLVEAYRPKRFEDVIGQVSVVDCLSGLIKRGQRGRDILLHGAVGSGKTSLAWIYARALNCHNPGAGGSPCAKCAPCRSDEPWICGIDKYDTARRGGGRSEVEEWTTGRFYSSKQTRFKILFFDEAQALTPQGCDVLLDLIEKPEGHDRGVLFFFATTEIEQLSEALRSRLFDLLVRPLTREKALELLKRIADDRNIAYDEDALRLLAGLRGGYPRNLLHGLERVYENDTLLTVAQVRAAFDVDQTEPLLAYFRALAAGDLNAQTEVMTAWQEQCFDKIRWVQAFLLSLYYNDIRYRRLAVDGVIDAITPSERLPILRAFCDRLDLREPAALEPIFARMLAFWPVPIPEVDEAALMLRVTLFHRLVNEGLSAEHGTGALHLITDLASTAPTDSDLSGFGPPRPMPARPLNACEPTSEPGHLTAADVRQIINCASFLVQEYNVFFNVTLSVRPKHSEMATEAAAVASIHTFHDDLARQVADWGGTHFASLALLARDEDGVHGRIVAHLSRPARNQPGPDCVRQAEVWCQTWQEDGIGQAEVRFKPFAPAGTKAGAACAFHWSETLALCTGLGAEVEDWDPVAMERQPLLRLLELKPNDTALALRAQPLVTPSEALSEAAIARACPRGLIPLSAFDDRAWAWIRKGWEGFEFEDRRAAKATRERMIADVVVKHGAASPAARAALEDWERDQSADPHQRTRCWPAWWQ